MLNEMAERVPCFPAQKSGSAKKLTGRPSERKEVLCIG